MTITDQDIERAREYHQGMTVSRPTTVYEFMAEYAAHVTADKDAEIERLRKIAKDCSLEVDKYARAVDKAHKRITAAEERAAETLTLLNAEIAKHQWRPIAEAPKDRTIIWAKFRNDIYPTICPDREDLKRWNGVQVPLKLDGMYWGVAAPVGMGGFPDEWIEGWVNTPESPRTEDGE